MQRNELERVIKENGFVSGGTKEACVKIRDFLFNLKCDEKTISSFSCVENEDFIEAVKIVIAHTYPDEDTVPVRWGCDNACQLINQKFCPGECNISIESNLFCPYFQNKNDV